MLEHIKSVFKIMLALNLVMYIFLPVTTGVCVTAIIFFIVFLGKRTTMDKKMSQIRSAITFISATLAVIINMQLTIIRFLSDNDKNIADFLANQNIFFILVGSSSIIYIFLSSCFLLIICIGIVLYLEIISGFEDNRLSKSKLVKLLPKEI